MSNDQNTDQKVYNECIELKNIKYQTMLLNSNATVVSYKKESANINKYLSNETDINLKNSWSKLGKHLKIPLLYKYLDKLALHNKLTECELIELQEYIVISLDRKKLNRIKDVIYDKALGEIIGIPGLVYDPVKKGYTLKRVDKKNNTLKSMAPKKRRRRRKKRSVPLQDNM